MLAAVARGLRDLNDKVVFVGGATVDLYITDSAAPPTRVTDDVDCVIELASRLEYHRLEEQLRALGFSHPMDEAGAPICRWKFAGLTVDVMPTDPSVLGFSNRWYSEGIANAESAPLPNGPSIAIFTLPYFIASKIEAFLGRGQGDFYGSPDIEDIVAVVQGAADIAEKILAAPATVTEYLQSKFTEFLRNPTFVQSLEGHLGPGPVSGSSQRVVNVLQRITQRQRLPDSQERG